MAINEVFRVLFRGSLIEAAATLRRRALGIDAADQISWIARISCPVTQGCSLPVFSLPEAPSFSRKA